MITVKINKVKSWSDTLTEFLLSSNEDEKVLDLFEENILESLIKLNSKKELNWLEVGVGNGDKTLMIAKLLKNYNRVNLTVCEPSTDWLDYLEDSNFQSKLPSNINLNIQNKTIEELVDENTLNDFDFISIIQVMYSQTIKNSIVEYVEKNSFKKPFLVWVDVEDKSGDFFKMRQLINKKIDIGVHSYIDELTDYLKEHDIKFNTFFTKEKVCKFNKREVLKKDNHWIFPFVIGNSFEEFEKMDFGKKREAMKIIRNYIMNIDGNLLNIPDISILISSE